VILSAVRCRPAHIVDALPDRVHVDHAPVSGGLLLIGTTADRVAHHAHCPVMVVS
jgi:hypothetical protein